MPYASQRDLRGKHPIDVFPYLVSIDNTGSLFDGTGSVITDLNVTASNSISASYEVIYETSSSYANFADSSSFLAGLETGSIVVSPAGDKSTTTPDFRFDGETVIIAGNDDTSSLQIGLLNLQSPPSQNIRSYIGHNVHRKYSDGKFYRESGSGGILISLIDDEFSIRATGSGVAGSQAFVNDDSTVVLKANAPNGTVGLGGNFTSATDDFSGASLVVDSTGTEAMVGGITSSFLQGTSSWATNSRTASVVSGSAGCVLFVKANGLSTTNEYITFNGSELLLSGASTASLKIGVGLQLQEYNFNNSWISDNIFYDGNNFVYTDGLFGEMIYFINGETRFINVPQGGAPGLTIDSRSLMKISQNGWVAIGNAITDEAAGATMVVSASGVNVYRGGITSSLVGTSSWTNNISASGVTGGLTQDIYLLSASVATMSFVNGILISVV